MLKRTTKRLLWMLSPRLYGRLIPTTLVREYSIGIAHGTDLADLCSAIENARPALNRDDITDIPAAFVADPFLMRAEGAWHMFFEIMSRIDFQGCIGHAVSQDGLHWSYQGVVLKETSHVAYPQVFQWQGSSYMLPDTPGRGLRLYRAAAFPEKWRLERTLLHNRQLTDSSLFRHEGYWWLAAWEVAGDGRLRLFSAGDLSADWIEHPSSPIVEPPDQRPGGRVVTIDGAPYRFVQNSTGAYGRYVRMRRIERLTHTQWLERDVQPTPLLNASGDGWRRDGMHHIDLQLHKDGGFLASVDGIQDRRER